jgi:hypothetical protein
MTRIGEFRYTGNGKTLEQNEEYTVYEADGVVEAYSEGESEPVEMKKATFFSLQAGNLEQIEGETPMR